MDLDAAPLPLLCRSCHEYPRKDKYTIKLMPYFSRRAHHKVTTCMQCAHFTHTPNMYTACNSHTHCKHDLSMLYDGRTHTTSIMNICVHAPQRRGYEHACTHFVCMRGCSMHACSVRYACLYALQASRVYSC
jgi:hypothetical protein